MSWTDPVDLTAGELTVAEMNAIVENIRVGFPPGKLEYFVRAATSVETLIASGWLECNGVAVLRATYGALNTLLSGLSYPFGAGNGTTTFNVPDLSGRGLFGMAASGHTNVNALGDSDGLTKANRNPELAAHTHTTDSHTHTGPSHTHGAGSYAIINNQIFGAGAFNGSGAQTIGGTSAAGGTGSTGSGGGGSTSSSGAFDNAYLVAGVWAIKT